MDINTAERERPAAAPGARKGRGWTARANTIATVLLAISSTVTVVVALTYGGDAGMSLAKKTGLVPAAQAKPAPELAGITHWLNSEPVTMSSLRGKVVLVDFWKYTCLNCRHEMPFLAKLHDTYAQRGLVVLGVHSPEFEFEKAPANVARGAKELHVTWPVAEDPNRTTWDAFRAQYWPSAFLVDRAGRLRYLAIGQSDQAKTEDALRELLADGGDPGSTRAVAPGTPTGDQSVTAPGLTHELFLAGARAATAVPGGVVADGATVDRDDAGDTADAVYLHGRFTATVDYLASAAPGARLDLRYRARDVYALVEGPDGSAAEVEVLLDGKPVPADRRGPDLRVGTDGHTFLRLDVDDIHHLVTGPALAEGRLAFVARTAGVRFFVLKFRA